MIDSTNPRILADNIRHLSGESESQGNAIGALQIYDDSETDTGKTWIDGSPIYRRVLTGTTGDTLNSITSAISTAGMGIVNVIRMEAYVYTNDYFTVNSYGFNAYYLYTVSALGPSVRCRVTQEAYLSSPLVVIIEYTKVAPAVPSPDLAPAPDDTRSIELEVRDPEALSDEIEQIPEPEVQEVKKTTRKKSTN